MWGDGWCSWPFGEITNRHCAGLCDEFDVLDGFLAVYIFLCIDLLNGQMALCWDRHSDLALLPLFITRASALPFIHRVFSVFLLPPIKPSEIYCHETQLLTIRGLPV